MKQVKRFQVGMTLDEVLAIIYAKNSPWVSVPSESDTRFSVVHMYSDVAPLLVFENEVLTGIYW